MTTTSKIVSMSQGCRTPDGQHIYGDNERCLICYHMKNGSNRTSRVLVIVISAESSDCQRVDQLTEIIEAQVRGVLKTVELIEDGDRRLGPPPKRVEMEVCAS